MTLEESITLRSKWTALKEKTTSKIKNGWEYSTGKIELGYDIASKKIVLGWQWLRARSSEEILFGARTTGSSMATIFAILTGIGLTAGWTAPGLVIIFMISVGIFAGAELTTQIRAMIHKRSPPQKDSQEEGDI